MAKQQIRQYAFTPGNLTIPGKIEILGKWDLNQITLITNSTRNTILYNFADPQYAGTTAVLTRSNSTNFPTATQASDGTTMITLVSNTVGQSSTDNIQIFVERNEQIVRPWALGTDAFERTRMAAPQSMLDADFEYGLQPTKWQTINLMRGYPSVYEIPGTDLQSVTGLITDASGGASADISVESLITVTSSAPHGLTTGTIVSVKAINPSVTGFSRAEGNFIIHSVTGTNIFSYYAKSKVGTTVGESLMTPSVQIRKGGFYTSSNVNNATYTYAGGGASTTATITVSFSSNHGLAPGSTIISVVSSDNGSNLHALAQGPFYVTAIPSLTQIQYLARSVGAISGTITGIIYARPDSFYLHRPLDGGVSLGAGGPQHGSSAIRQSKKYIRYQSGKAVNYNTGALFAPNYDLRSLTATTVAVAGTVTVVTDDVDHGLQTGAIINISGVTSTGYNGNYTVSSVINERTFTYVNTSTLSTTTAVLSTPCLVSLVNWYGSTVRAGTFDDQNGMFWQYDGQTMALGLRSSIAQLAGTVIANPDSNLIFGTNTRFDQQLAAGDRVVIRGMTHVVTSISSSTWMYVNPDYRGVSAISGVRATKTREILVPQNQWNQDRCDGSNGPFNPSGYNINVSKMQMIGIQWTWYGAGFIDYMLRGPDGNYITVHRIKNSNVNNEAYMRSGNMPVRYEVQNESARSTLVSSISSVDTAMTVTDVTFFPNTGTVYIDNEIINYSIRSTSSGIATLSGLTRSTPLSQFAGGTTRSFTAGSAASHVGGTGVILVGATASPIISHWGSAFITDGGFDQDRGYIFSHQAINVNVSTKKTTAFAIRLAPSVSNAIVGDLGVRELINRAQLLLQSIGVTAGGTTNVNSAIIVEGVLNPSNYPTTATNVVWNSLNSIALPTGQPSFCQIASSSGITFDNTATINTTANNNFNTGTSIIGVASTASILIGDALVNNTTPSAITGGTIVSSIGAGTITLSLPLAGRMLNNDSLSFLRNSYALPGETIFSFLNSPNGTDRLDLVELKELTNTPLGGRGTFPNGPDVLMINVYLTQGSPILANLILRWGEAQA